MKISTRPTHQPFTVQRKNVSWLALSWVSVGCALALTSFTVMAQDGGASFKVGETNVTPSVRIDFFQNDNGFLTPTETTEVTGFIIRPAVTWGANRRLLNLSASYAGEYASVSESALNYVDHSFGANVEAKLSSRKMVQGGLQIRYDHQTLGRGLTRGNADATEQVEFLAIDLQSAFVYGAESARGNVEVGLNIESVSYQNRPDLTTGNGYTELRPYGQFSLRVSSDTRALFEVELGKISFGRSTSDRDDISLLAGLKFAPTGKLSGEFKLGTTISSFAESGRVDETTAVADADLVYELSALSTFELSLSRGIASEDIGSVTSGEVFSVTDTAELEWRYSWSSRLSHEANLGYRAETNSCPDADVGVMSAGLEINLAINRWLRVGTSFNNQTRKAAVCSNADEEDLDLDYDLQRFGVHIRATL